MKRTIKREKKEDKEETLDISEMTIITNLKRRYELVREHRESGDVYWFDSPRGKSFRLSEDRVKTVKKMKQKKLLWEPKPREYAPENVFKIEFTPKGFELAKKVERTI